MIQFHSMQAVSIWTVIVVILFIWFGSKKQPLAIASSFIQTFKTSKRFIIAVIALVLILLMNKYELDIERMMNLSWDFTPVVHQIEGNFVYTLQQLFYNPVLTGILGFFYLVVFQALIVSSIAIYISNNYTKMAIAVCYAIIINYVIAIPFYLFVPVNEAWAYPPSGVQFHMLDIFPSFEEQYRPLSGLNNCFPSLHTSVSVTVAILAIRSGIRRWQWLASISAALIVFSIFYLGIHWLSDMIAGVALASFASWMGMKLAGVEPAMGVGARLRREQLSGSSTVATKSNQP